MTQKVQSFVFERGPITFQMLAQRAREGFQRYSGYIRFSEHSDIYATTVQILLRTGYFTDSLQKRSGDLFDLFQKLHEEMKKLPPYLDINPLIKFTSSALGDKSELVDYFSGLFGLFGSPIPHISSPTGVIFHIPHDNSIIEYFSELGADAVLDLGVIFFDTRSVVLRDIPETLGDFSLYVVVNRRSKSNHRLWFQDSRLVIHCWP
jgi:hypothetical protein